MKKFVSKILVVALVLMSMQAMAVVQVSASTDGIYTLSPIADASVGGAGWSGTTVLSTNTGNDASVKFGSQYFESEDFFGCGGNVVYKQCTGYLAYFKFDIANTFDFETQYIKKATLKLTYALSNQTDGAGGLGFWKVDDNSWTEDGLTYNNSPLKTTQIGVSADSGKIVPDVLVASRNNMSASPTAYEYDITDLLRKYSLSDENSVISFASILGLKYNFYATLETKESATESYRPTLTIETDDIQPLATESCPVGDVVYTDDISVVYNNTLNPVFVNTDTVTLWCDGEKLPLSQEDISVSDKTITVTYPKKPFKTYTLKISGVISDIYNQVMGEDGSYSFNTVTNTTDVKISASKFNSAMYDTEELAGTGTSDKGDSGWLPYLYAGGVYREYYCVVDISDLAGKAFSKVIYNLFCNGSISVSLYKLNGDFDPGVSAYGELPLPGDVFQTFAKPMGNGDYAQIDITDYVRETILSGSTSLKFMLKQNNASTTNLANESSWSSWVPYLTATVEDETYIALKSSNPTNNEIDFGCEDNIELVLTADVAGAGAENVTLTNVTDGQQVSLSANEVTFVPAQRKIVINPSAALEGNKEYQLDVSGLYAGPVVQGEDISISFTTVKDEIVLTNDGMTFTASVYVGANAADYALIIAQYESDKLVNITGVKGVNLKDTISHSLTATGSTTPNVKAFLWSSDSCLKPIKTPAVSGN